MKLHYLPVCIHCTLTGQRARWRPEVKPALTASLHTDGCSTGWTEHITHKHTYTQTQKCYLHPVTMMSFSQNNHTHTHLSIFTDAEDSVFIVAKLHTVNFPIMSSPAHSTLIPLHVYRRVYRRQCIYSIRKIHILKKALWVWRQLQSSVIISEIWIVYRRFYTENTHDEHWPNSLMTPSAAPVTSRFPLWLKAVQLMATGSGSKENWSWDTNRTLMTPQTQEFSDITISSPVAAWVIWAPDFDRDEECVA